MAKPILTKKRARWAAQRTNVTMKGKRLNYNASVQEKYVRKLEKLVDDMAQATKKAVIKLFKSPTAKEFYGTAMDANIASQARILTNYLTNTFNQLFNAEGQPAAEEMVNAQNKLSASNLFSSLSQLSGGLSIKTNVLTPDLKTIMKASVAENVALIKSIGSQYLSSVQKAVMRSITTGEGLKDLEPALEKYEGISKRHAKNVALDQTRKVYNSFNKGRMEKVGVKKFQWIHSGGGQKPRPDHIEMSGNIYSFDDLPVIDEKTGEKGIPGQAINCRCTMTPVIEFDNDEEQSNDEQTDS